MIMKPEIMSRIKEHFNLNIYETKVWLALLSKGIATAGEVAEISNVPRSRTYDVLESLEKQGFAILKLGKPVKYIAVNPSIVLERLKTNIIKESDDKVKMLSEIKDNVDYKQLVILHKQGLDPVQVEEMSGMIKGRANIHNHIKGLISKASKNVLISSTASDILRKKWLKSLCDSLGRKNIKVKILVNGSEGEVKNLAKELNLDMKHSSIHSRFAIADNKEMLFMLTPDSANEDNDFGVWINSSFFVSAMSSLFDLAWEK